MEFSQFVFEKEFVNTNKNIYNNEINLNKSNAGLSKEISHDHLLPVVKNKKQIGSGNIVKNYI